MSPRDPFEELSNANPYLSDETQASHLAAIDAALEARNVVPIKESRFSPMRWVAAAVILVGIGAPSAVVASAGSLPGDLLYPIKQISEPILIRFDAEVVARHRIDEVVKLRARDLPAADVLREAEDAVGRLPLDSPLRDELARLGDRDREVTDAPPASRPPTTAPPATEVRDRRTSTTTSPPEVSVPTTTTPDSTTTPPPDRTTTTLPESDR